MWSCDACHIKVRLQSLYHKSLPQVPQQVTYKVTYKVSITSLANVGAPRVSYLLTQTFEFPWAAAYFRVAKFRTLKNSLPPFYTSPKLLVPPFNSLKLIGQGRRRPECTLNFCQNGELLR